MTINERPAIRNGRRLAVALTLAFFVVALGDSAQAQPSGALADPTDPAAIRHVERGRKYFDTEEWDLAIKEFKAAALIDPVPKLFFNLGQANRFAGNHEEARRHYLRFLDKIAHMKGRDIEAIRQTAEQLAADMEAAANREPTGTVPPEADPKPLPTQPDPAPTAQTGRVDLPPRDAPPRGGKRWVALSMLAGGAVLGVAAGGAYLAAESKEDQANAELVRSERDRLFEQSDTRRTLGHVCAAVGGAAVLGGIVTLVLTRSSSHSPGHPTVSISAGSSWTGVAASLRF